MSIYRSFAKHRLERGHDVCQTGDPPPPARTVLPAPTQAPDRDWSAVRRSKPVHYMLRSTIQWYAQLPVDERPEALAKKYARITNLLAVHWSDPAACGAYFDDLLTDRRGGRRGFPPPVRAELLRLRDYYYAQYLARGR